MKSEKLWEQYQHYTRDVTEQGRKLAFAGVAICWIFKTDDYSFPQLIYASLLLFTAYFIFDILHALSGALMVKMFVEKEEGRQWKETGSIQGEINKPRWVDRPAFVLFIIKCILLTSAFFAIGTYVFWEIHA